MAGHPKANPQTAATASGSYFNRKTVRRKIEERQTKMMKRFEIDEDRIAQELGAIAFFDPIELLDDDGNLKPISEIPEHTRRAMSGVDIYEIYTGIGEARKKIGAVKKAKIISKREALDSLAKLLGFNKEKLTLDGKVKVERETDAEVEERLKLFIDDHIKDALQ